jgi:hypothetical protein
MPTRFLFNRHYACNLQIASHFITLSLYHLITAPPLVAAPGRAVLLCYPAIPLILSKFAPTVAYAASAPPFCILNFEFCIFPASGG